MRAGMIPTVLGEAINHRSFLLRTAFWKGGSEVKIIGEVNSWLIKFQVQKNNSRSFYYTEVNSASRIKFFLLPVKERISERVVNFIWL